MRLMPQLYLITSNFFLVVRFNDISKLVKFREFWIMVRYAALHLKFGENVKNPIIQRNVNFVGEHSSRAYFIGIVLLIKN